MNGNRLIYALKNVFMASFVPYLTWCGAGCCAGL